MRAAQQAAADDLGRIRPALHRALGDARRRVGRLPRFHGCIADDEDLGMARGSVRSGSTITRPDRSVAAPSAARPSVRTATRARRRPTGGRARLDDLLGAVRAGDPDGGLVDRHDTSPRPDLDPQPLELPLGRADRSGGYGGRTRSTASTRTIRASPGRIERKSRLSVSWAISPSAPASSTPVGPPPTMTKVIHARRRSGSASRSAASKAMRTRVVGSRSRPRSS